MGAIAMAKRRKMQCGSGRQTTDAVTTMMTMTTAAVALLLVTATAGEAIKQSELNLNRPIIDNPQHKQSKRQLLIKGQTPLRHRHRHHRNLKKKKAGGAYNPNLLAYDPNSSEYQHGNPALGSFTNGKIKNDNKQSNTSSNTASSTTTAASSSSWSPCPPNDPTFTGNRASYDCLSYIYCAAGQVRGSYSSCMGLKFDNTRGVCDWAETVTCEYETTTGGSSSSNEGGEETETAAVTTKEMGSASAISVTTSNAAGSNGATATGPDGAVVGWHTVGSEWGGAWVNGQWVPDGGSTTSDERQQPMTQWDTNLIQPYPPHEILPCHNPNTEALSSSSASLPSSYTSPEGWSHTTRSDPTKNGSMGKTVIGYYAAWQWYDNAERASPKNMQFNKVDRVNFAFFQSDVMGNIWGTDSWADPIILFGPHNWSVDVPNDAGNAPQFHDDNGFDDSSGPEWNYVGQHYIDLGPNVFCHRATPTGRRDCNGHSPREGLIGRAHEQGALVYPSIGGWSLSDVFPEMSANAASRRNFAKNCVGLIREYNFDGIDIDWEFPGYAPHSGTPADRQNFVLLLQDIRSALDAYTKATYPNGERTFGLTAALPCGPPIIDHQDVPQVSSILTELNLMTYDFHGTWDDIVGINAPLFDQPEDKFYSPEYSVHGCVERWIRDGADKSKINVGLPFYGRSYGGSTELYADFDGADGMNWWMDEGQPQYYNILDQISDMISVRDDVTKTQYAYFKDGGIISFDDNQAICDKVEYARENELHGFLIWELSGDLTEDLMTPLLDVVNFKLQQGDEFDCELFRLETRGENGEVLGLANAGAPQPWYAHWESGTCVNDGKHPAWLKEDQDLFRFKQECCSYKFEYKFDVCVGPPTYEPTNRPTPEPSLSPIITASPTDRPTHIFGAAQVQGVTTDSSPVPSPVSTVARNAMSEGGPEPPITWCLGGCQGANEKCVGNQNHPQNIDDDSCRACQAGQKYWPCDVDGLCFCWDPDTPRIPPAPGSGLAQLSDERPCDYFTKAIFDSLAPEAQHPYTYEGLCKAIDNYNAGHAEKIFMMGTEKERKSELASFLGHTLHESDEWKASREYLMCADHRVVGSETFCKPCDSGSFNWETFTCDGVGLAGGGLTFNGYCDHTIEPPAACPCDDTLKSEPAPLEGYIPASKVFFGRGAIQLSWNYNFRAASEALTGDATTFCDDPDLVATTPEYAWGAGVFFWMENLKEETTCHIEALKSHDFGGTLNNINGGLECPAYHGGWHGEAIKLRLNRYCKATTALGLDEILIFDGCKGLNESFAECLGDGTCPDCDRFDDGTGTSFMKISAIQAHPASDSVVSDPVAMLNPVEPAVTPGPTAQPTPNPTSQPVEAEIPACPDGLQAVDGLPGCCVPEPAYHGDGACDPDAPQNSAVCNFDGGDCCQETCDLESTYGCSAESFGYGPFGYFCVNPDLDEYIDPDLCTVTDRTRVGDGRCDAGVEMYNTEACNWDGGDCCEETCDQRYAHFDCGDPAYPYSCENPDLSSTSTNPLTPQPTPLPTSNPTPKPTRLNIESFVADSFVADDPIESSPDVEPSIVTVIASADATIKKGAPDSNFGTDPILKVKGLSSGPNAHDSIIRFVIPESGVSSPVEAMMKIYSLKDADHGGIFHIASETFWSESSVSWNSAPDWGARLENIGPVHEGQWYMIDVSDAVSSLNGSEGAITLRIRSRASEMTEYSSKEGNHPPEIAVIYDTPPSVSNADMNFNSAAVQTTIPGQFILNPSDDAYIVADRPDENYGFDTALQVDDDSGVYDTLIRFDVSNIETRAIASAKLRLYCIDGSDSGGIIGKVRSNWNEGVVTWNNAPQAVGTPIHNMGAVQKAVWYEVDLTSLFNGNSMNAVSIRITSNSWNRAGYSSKEGSEPPELVIQMDDEVIQMKADSFAASDVVCTADVRLCPGGTYVPRDPANGCNFESCPQTAESAPSSGTGLFYPVWGDDGTIACVDDDEAPSWVIGDYLKESKSDCCKAYFSLQINKCLGASSSG